jgi:hypothetical protein
VSGELVIPGTGELVSPDDPPAIARAVAEVAELQRRLYEFRTDLTALLVEEAKLQGTKTLHLPGTTVTLSGGTKTKWDVDKLRELELAGLPAERLNELLRPAVTYSPSGTIARQLVGANPDYRRIIEEARSEEPAPWRATVKLAARGPEHVDVDASEVEQVE